MLANAYHFKPIQNDLEQSRVIEVSAQFFIENNMDSSQYLIQPLEMIETAYFHILRLGIQSQKTKKIGKNGLFLG